MPTDLDIKQRRRQLDLILVALGYYPGNRMIWPKEIDAARMAIRRGRMPAIVRVHRVWAVKPMLHKNFIEQKCYIAATQWCHEQNEKAADNGHSD